MDKELIEDAEIDNSVFDGITGVTRAIHLCRGNAPRGRWLANGGYESIADKLYPRLTNYDALLLEYDSPRAGDFSSLAHVRPDTVVVLGLVTTKDGKLEDKAAVEAHSRGGQARAAGAARAQPAVRLRVRGICRHDDDGPGGRQAASGRGHCAPGLAKRLAFPANGNSHARPKNAIALATIAGTSGGRSCAKGLWPCSPCAPAG
jgi:Methionine synthase II (cobalamin-independent)